ncbi:sensor histidine kinase [Paenibacillus sp. JNUCC31]|uniref:sensor histidine kinase n=1 Tax=Paenibacillus sp. JNUCC-31 TaxID=2777983 RepID=UPI001E51CF51|nr:histidine kinase [Paenibacillus sp. JNUCC-31]
MNDYERDRLIQDLIDKMNLQSFTEGWNNHISLYSPIIDKWINPSTNQKAPPTSDNLNQWTLDLTHSLFTLRRPHEGYTIEVTFPQNNLQHMLDSAKVENNDPFFYHPDYPIVTSSSPSPNKIEELIHKLSIPRLYDHKEGSVEISIAEDKYMVNFFKSSTLGWYLIDYVPLDQALQPIMKTQRIFYVVCLMLVLASVTHALFLYRKVQIPILTLLKGVRHLKKGSFSHRIEKSSLNEFDILYQNFNDMAEQIEELIEKVYKEKIISREAQVKQLQAQINPHFLYNCLFFINNMNRLGNEDAITAMTENLAEYFRYTTRLNDPLTTLQKELAVVQNYLNIQCLRMTRLRYEINIPDSMNQLLVPKLLIQPLVENSLIHGIEKKQAAGIVRIECIESQNQYRLLLDDDGIGMTNDEIQELLYQIMQPLTDTIGCALWNIQQRMDIFFMKPAGINIDKSPLGGLRIELYWPKENLLEE